MTSPRRVAWLLVFLCTGAARAEPPAEPKTAQPRPEDRIVAAPFDVLQLRPGDVNRAYSIEPTEQRALARGRLLRQLCDGARPGDTLVLAPTEFDLDGRNAGTLFLPDQITLTSPGLARLTSNVYSDDQGAAFEIKNGWFNNISFDNQSWKIDEDGRTIQFVDGVKRTADNVHLARDSSGAEIIDAPPATYAARFTNCVLRGTAWTVYDWSGKGNQWRFEDCAIIAGRQGLSMMSNSGPKSVLCEALRCRFDLDASRSQDVGWTSNAKVGGVYAVVARSGTVRLIDCEFHLKGKKSTAPSYTPRCVGVFDGNDFGSICDDHTQIELLNPRFYVDGNGATDVFDILITNKTVRSLLKLSGGWGSGRGGAITKSWETPSGTGVSPVRKKP